MDVQKTHLSAYFAGVHSCAQQGLLCVLTQSHKYRIETLL